MGNITAVIASDLIASQDWYCYEPTLIDRLLMPLPSWVIWLVVAFIIVFTVWILVRGIENE